MSNGSGAGAFVIVDQPFSRRPAALVAYGNLPRPLHPGLFGARFARSDAGRFLVAGSCLSDRFLDSGSVPAHGQANMPEILQRPAIARDPTS